jgi:hypothetical protein
LGDGFGTGAGVAHGGTGPAVQVTFTDGGEDIREPLCYLNPDPSTYRDWFHITMRITVMTNTVKSLRAAPPDETNLSRRDRGRNRPCARPTRRSQRAELPHWAPALGGGMEACVGAGTST